MNADRRIRRHIFTPRHPRALGRAAMRWLALACFAVLAAADRAAAIELFAATTTFEVTGSCSVVQSEPPFGVECDLYTIHSDAVVRRDGRYVFVVNRRPANNILVLDAQNGYAVVRQFGTGDGTNPGDIDLVDATRAYVSLYEKTYLLIVNPFTGQHLGSIDLSAFADADGVPEIDQIVVIGGRAFVAIQRLDRGDFWLPAGGSGLAVIDIATDSVIDADPTTPAVDLLRLQLQNPFWQLRWEPALHRLVAVCPGSFLELDGGIEAINPFTLQSDRVVAHETDLGGEVSAAAFASPAIGWAIVNDAAFNTCLVRFDPGTGQSLAPPLCTAGFLLSDLELSAAGRVYVGDRTPSAPGIRVFDAVAGNELTGAPVDICLPPFDMVLLENAPLPNPPELPATVARLSAAPNPFNPAVTLRLTRAAGTGAGPALRIVDARGRLTARLLPVQQDVAGGAQSQATIWLYRWDGTSSDGRPAASGRYWAAAENDSATPLALTLVR